MLNYGCDIEVCLVDNTGQAFIPDDIVRNANVPWLKTDGFAAEFETDVFTSNNIHNLSRQIYERLNIIKKIAAQKLLNISLSPVYKINEEQFQTATENNKNLGCSPDTCIYYNTMNKENVMREEIIKKNRIKKLQNLPFRTLGAHIHIGDDIFSDLIIQMAQHIIPIIDRDICKTPRKVDIQRRKFYGGAGCYRIKPYGIEYRSLPTDIFIDNTKDILQKVNKVTIDVLSRKRTISFNSLINIRNMVDRGIIISPKSINPDLLGRE